MEDGNRLTTVLFIFQRPEVWAVILIAALLAVFLRFCIYRRRKLAKEQDGKGGEKGEVFEGDPSLLKPQDPAAYRDTEMQMPEQEHLEHLLYMGKTQGIGKRADQQDHMVLSEEKASASTDGKGIFALVADGMGGLTDGGKVSQMTGEIMLATFMSQKQSISADQLLLSMLYKANSEIKKHFGVRRSGSTMAGVIVRGYDLYWAAVGDSRICLWRKGQLVQVNREHIYGEELDRQARKGEISREQAQSHPQRGALTSFIGMGDIGQIDRNIRPFRLLPGDRILLMTDGVFRTLNDLEISEILKQPAMAAAEALERMIRVKDRQNQDNYTAVILEYREGER